MPLRSAVIRAQLNEHSCASHCQGIWPRRVLSQVELFNLSPITLSSPAAEAAATETLTLSRLEPMREDSWQGKSYSAENGPLFSAEPKMKSRIP